MKNKLLKKLFILSLVFALGCSAFSGCGRISNNKSSNISNPETKETTYLDITFSDEKNTYTSKREFREASLDKNTYNEFLNSLQCGEIFTYSDYYALNDTLRLYIDSNYDKKYDKSLLNSNGMLDTKKLIAKVKENNKSYLKDKNVINTFYEEISESDLKYICDLISKTVNEQPNGVSLEAVADTLLNLKLFVKKGSASNAYVTDDLTFVFSPTMTGMYADMQKITGAENDSETVKKTVIIHEIMHILQHSSNDRNQENGLEVGFCRNYNQSSNTQKAPVDSLYWPWVLEASAELGMADYLNRDTYTYAKKISYARSFDISRFNLIKDKSDCIDKIAFLNSLEQAYNKLGLTDETEKKEFLEFMFSVEITQSEPDDFWENYTLISKKEPDEEEKLNIRMEIRAQAVKYMAKAFYKGLASALAEGKIRDLDTVFYLMRIWELDSFSHLRYTETDAFLQAKDYILYVDSIQNALFKALSYSNNLSLEQISSLYNEYFIYSSVNDEVSLNCDLSKVSGDIADLLGNCTKGYNLAKFARNSVLAEYIKNN